MPITLSGITFDLPDVILSVIVSVVFFVLSIYVTHYYYEKQKLDAISKDWAEKLKWLHDVDRSFLVAVFKWEKPLPLYAFLEWHGKNRNDKPFNHVCAAPECFKSLNLRESLLCKIHRSGTPYSDMT
jgi:hypothetical protein